MDRHRFNAISTPTLIEPEPSDGQQAPIEVEPGSRAALYVFVALVVVAVPLLLHLGDHRWFLYDEWDFLAGRDGGDVGDLLRPHGGAHWVTLPILWYRLMWNLVGITTYVPYQLLLVVLHLTAAVLLRVIMRRCGVRPWIATAAAALFVVFGAGNSNIVWAFQVTVVGSLVFGLAFLILADRDGPFVRSDVVGMLAGLGALMCSGFGLVMVAVVGLAALIRRGWRVAALLTAPLAGVYLLWLVTSAADEYADQPRPSPGELVRFVATGVAHGFDSLGQVFGVGIVLVAVLVVGLWVAWSPVHGVERRRRVATPVALLAGAGAVYVMIGLQRAGGGDSPVADASRYAHFFAALLLPPLAVAADAIVRRWRVMAIPMIAVFLIGIPGNIAAFRDPTPVVNAATFHSAYRSYMLNAAVLPEADELPRSAHVDRFLAPEVTLGWLLDGVKSGRIPRPDVVDRRVQAKALGALALTFRIVGKPKDCRLVALPAQLDLQRGQQIELNGGASIVVIVDGTTRSVPLVYGPPLYGEPVDAVAPSQRSRGGSRRGVLVPEVPINVEMSALDPAHPPQLCG